MKPNTVVMGWHDDRVPEDPKDIPDVLSKFPAPRNSRSSVTVSEYVSMIKDVLLLKKNIILAKK